MELSRGEIAGLPPEEWDSVIVATGPLTSPALSEAIRSLTGETALSFFDAIAPIVYRETIDMDKAWLQSRWDRNETGTSGDYINCALEKPEYLAFIDALLTGEKGAFKEWETDTPYFEGCLPIEVMAERGPATLRFGPMKPVGLTNPRASRPPYAVVQLRQDNALGTLYNMVGFQTKLKHGEQVRIFRTIPGLERAEFARLGGLHRNTFINSPKLLDEKLRLKAMPRLRFAGQITGVEGYVESAAIGLLGRPLRRRGAPRRRRGAAARHHRARRTGAPHHGQRQQRQLPADEREFRPVPGAARARGPDPRPGARMEDPAQAADVPPRAQRSVGWLSKSAE